MQLPPGYQIHPDNPQYMYSASGDVRPIPPQETVAQPTALYVGVPATPAAYGTVDVNAMTVASESLFDSKRLYLDFPKSTAVGETYLQVRLLPPWRSDLHIPFVHFASHRMPASMVPNPGQRQWVYVTCYNPKGGPGNCPICATMKSIEAEQPELAEKVNAYRIRPEFVWQALDLGNLAQHFTQRVDPATRQPALNGQGQPVYDVMPGILRVRTTMHKSIMACFQEETKGDATDIEHGYPFKLIRNRTGASQFDVEYRAMDLAKAPLDANLRPVLLNLIDLQADMVKYLSAEEMNHTATQMRHQIRPDAPATAYGGPLPVATQGLPVAAPAAVAPQAAVPQQAVVPPMNLPPVTAPGGVPAAPPAAAVPPTPLPGPGLPAAAAPPPAATPDLTLQPPGALTPEAFEEAQRSGKIPF